MRELTCFVIMPSNPRNSNATSFLQDNRWGLVENPSGCKGAVNQNQLTLLDFDTVYKDIIVDAIETVNHNNHDSGIRIRCIQGKDIPAAGDIISQIMRYVCSADITITDITGNNPNVFLEFGIRLSVCDALNIMMCHKNVKDRLPFDVKDLRCIDYSMDIAGAKVAKQQIVQFIQDFIDKNILEVQEHEGRGPGADGEPFSYFRRQVELHTGRLQERKLVSALEKSPKLLIDFASYFFANKKRPGLQQALFKFFDDLASIYGANPQGPAQALELLQSVSEIEGLSQEKLSDIYFQMYDMTKDDPELQDIAEKYLQLYEETED